MPNRGTFDAAAHSQYRWHTYPKGNGMRRLDGSDVAWWSDAGALLGIELPNLSAGKNSHQGVTLGTPAFFDADSAGERCAVLLDGVNDSISIGAAPYTEGYFDFRASDTHLISIPHHANYNLAGDLTLMVRLAAGSWTPGSTQTLFSRWLPGANKVVLFRLNGQGRLVYDWSSDGAIEFQVTSSSQVVPAASGDLWVGVTHDVNDGIGGNVVRFFTSTQASEPTSMTLLSAHTNPSVTTSFFASPGTPIRLGSRDSNQDRLYGRVKTAILRGSINGANIGLTSEVFRIDADVIVDEAATTLPVAVPAGQTATVTGSILKRPIGGAASFGPEESGTVMLCGLFEATQPSGARFFDSQPASLMGGQAIHATATSGAAITGRVALAGVGTETTVAETAITNGPDCVCLRTDRQASLLKIWTNSGGETTVALNPLQGSSQRFTDIRIGSSNENTQYANFDFYSGAIFRTAISDADRTLIKTMFMNASDTYDNGDLWTVTTPGIFDGTFYMPGDQVLATGTSGMDFAEVDWARIPAPTVVAGEEVVPEVPGYVDFPGTATNYLRIPLSTISADPSFDLRIEAERPTNPATGEHRIVDVPFYMGFSPTTIRVGAFAAADATTVSTAAPPTYATLEAAGFPQVGQWVHMRLAFDAATDVLTMYWRKPDLDITSDTGWAQAATVTAAGKQLRVSDATWNLTGTTAATTMKGKIRRWRLLINGSMWRDVNAAVDFVDGSVASFTSSSGQTVTVFRTSQPSTSLVPTVPEHIKSQPLTPTPTYFGIVEKNGPPSDIEASFFEDSVIYPYRRLDIHNFDNSLWFENAPLISGMVNIDYGRDERRSGDCEIWLPDTVIGPGGLWYDKVFKFYRGITFGPYHRDPNYAGASLVWQIGSFVADKISESSESANFKVTFRDLTKRMMLSKTTEAVTFPEGTEVAVVIRALAANSGIIDMLVPATGKEIGKDFTFEQGSSRWEIAKKIANDFGYELFFDHRGWLVMRKFIDPLTSPIYLNLVARRGGLGADGHKSNVGSYDRSASDERIYNHIVVIGEGTDRTIVYRAEAENTIPNSPTSISRIGRRTMTYTSSFITSIEQAQETANALLGINALEQFSISVGTIVYPWIEVGTTIRFDDDNPDDEFPSRYLLLSAGIPLGLEAMSLSGSRVTIIGTAPTS